ncbi:ERC protein 2-like isoform X1 [Styela clava]
MTDNFTENLPSSPRQSSNKSRNNGSSRTYSMENIQSLNAAYTTSPAYLSEFDLGNARSKTLGRISTGSHASSNKKNRSAGSNILGSSPNLMMSNYNSPNSISSQSTAAIFSQGHRYKNDRDSPANSSQSSNSPKMEISDHNSLHINENGKSNKRGSASDYILQIQQDNETLRREIDIKESKLQTNMNSIKNFWSPELKKERALRKEESTRATVLREQFKSSQDENQNLQLTIQALQDELRAQRDLNQLLQDDMSGSHNRDSNNLTSGSFSIDTRILQEEVDRLTRENELLQRTMEEMESRIEAQRQTLDARDESVRKLLEMLQSKAISQQDEDASETDSLRMQLVEAEARQAQLDSLIMERNCEISQLKKNISNSPVIPDNIPKIQSLQAIISMKDGKLAILERDLNQLEEEMAQMKREGCVSSEERQEELKQLEVYKSHSAFMKSKIEQLKCELQKKDTMLVTMQTKLDTLNNQQSDSRQHIDVLKESLAAKEQRAAILQAEVDSLRTRLEEKQQILDRKQEQLTVMQEERSSSGSEVAHLQDTLEVKDRKITVLHRKIESLAEVVREKDKQLDVIKDRLISLQQDSSTSDSALNTMEEALTEKEKIITRLRAELENGEDKWREDSDRFESERKSFEISCESLKQELSEKETSLSDLKEHASSLASAALKKDSHIKQIEINLQQTTEKLAQVETLLKKAEEDLTQNIAQSEAESAKTHKENQKKLSEVEKLAKEKDEEAKKCQNDLDRLLEILKETENEKHNKDKKLLTYDKQVRELQTKVKSLQNKMAEDSKLKGAAHSKDTAQFLSQMKLKDDRIEELEEALRESVSITAERETVLSKEQDIVRKLQIQQEDLMKQMKETKQLLDHTGSKLMATEASLHEKDRTLHTLRKERKKQLEELLEMKQEALLSAISEKDANIALLELSARKKANQDEIQSLKKEKDHLVAQLKQQTQNRLKLMQDNFDDPPSLSTPTTKPRSSSPSQHKRSSGGGSSRSGGGMSNHRPSPTEDDGEGIWA